jgi:hypothetical protein
MNKIVTGFAVAALLSIGAVASTTPAQAHGWHGGWHGGGHGTHKISCHRGRRIVRWSGFRRVKPVKCFGKYYVYRGWKWGKPYRVRVHSRRGFVAGAFPI